MEGQMKFKPELFHGLSAKMLARALGGKDKKLADGTYVSDWIEQINFKESFPQQIVLGGMYFHSVKRCGCISGSYLNYTCTLHGGKSLCFLE